jgi:hypothetical protein
MKPNTTKLTVILGTLAAIATLSTGHAEDPDDESVFDRKAATFDVAARNTKFLKEGCTLYTDRELKLKVRPKQLSATRYILASFEGCKVDCTKTGMAFVIGLFDVHCLKLRAFPSLNHLQLRKSG